MIPIGQVYRSLLLLLLGALFAMPSVRAEVPGPTLSASSEVAAAGYFQLRWALDDAEVIRYRVEEAADPDFREAATLYEGADRATVISGRGDGVFHYRVRAVLENGDHSGWSEPRRVEVAHHSLGQAIGLFILGGVVFLATVGLIVAGSRLERRVAGQS